MDNLNMNTLNIRELDNNESTELNGGWIAAATFVLACTTAAYSFGKDVGRAIANL